LNANNIEIPFPQRDIHIIHPKPEQVEKILSEEKDA
jgi:putative mechanosensitive ion channel